VARQQQVAAEAERVVADLEAKQNRDKALWTVQLQSSNLVRENQSDLMVNLNTQMANALAAEKPELVSAVNLFDDLLDQGVAAALEQQRQKQQQQERLAEGVGDAGETGLLLPQQYRPDNAAFMTYCRAVTRCVPSYLMSMWQQTRSKRTTQLQCPLQLINCWQFGGKFTALPEATHPLPVRCC
jgi:hypothetical protein